jgi:hypothetical protein
MGMERVFNVVTLSESMKREIERVHRVLMFYRDKIIITNTKSDMIIIILIITLYTHR